MTSRRKFMMKVQEYQKEYTELEYIESTGTQYFDSLYTPSSDTVIVLNCICKNNYFLFGTRNATSGTEQKRFAYYIANSKINTSTNPQWSNTNYTSCSNAYDLRQKTTVTFGKGGFWQNGTKLLDLTDEFQCGYTLYLFSCNTSGEASTAMGAIRLYDCKIYDSDVLIRDYIPVLDKSGKPCLYDKITKEYFYNQGTGEFLYKLKGID